MNNIVVQIDAYRKVKKETTFSVQAETVRSMRRTVNSMKMRVATLEGLIDSLELQYGVVDEENTVNV